MRTGTPPSSDANRRSHTVLASMRPARCGPELSTDDAPRRTSSAASPRRPECDEREVSPLGERLESFVDAVGAERDHAVGAGRPDGGAEFLERPRKRPRPRSGPWPASTARPAQRGRRRSSSWPAGWSTPRPTHRGTISSTAASPRAPRPAADLGRRRARHQAHRPRGAGAGTIRARLGQGERIGPVR